MAELHQCLALQSTLPRRSCYILSILVPDVTRLELSMRGLLIIRRCYGEAIILPALVLATIAMSAPVRIAAQRGHASSTQAAANSSASVAAGLSEAASLLQLGKLDEAEPILRRVIATAPRNADA